MLGALGVSVVAVVAEGLEAGKAAAVQARVEQRVSLFHLLPT